MTEMYKVYGFGFMMFNSTFKKYFSYIVLVSFIGRGNLGTQRKPDLLLVTDKLSHNVVLSTSCHEQGSNSQLER
jgi:hypothetical protein